MKSSAWQNSVIVSREQEARTYFREQNVSRLTDLEDPREYAVCVQYSRVYHDDQCKIDKGYFMFTDYACARNIYIASMYVGMSSAFHAEKRIESSLHLIKKNTNHQHHTDMTSMTRTWWFHNLIYVTLQIYNAKGNVVMFCKGGRSRSPIYLVVCLIIIYSMPVSEAMCTVESLLAAARHEVMDRHGCLTPIVEDISERNYNS